jgi:hypothetical protein
MDAGAVAKLCGYEAGCAKIRPELHHNAVVRSELEALQALAHLSRATEADSSRQGCHYVERRRHP